MMKGQIEEQEGNVQAARDEYNQGVSVLHEDSFMQFGSEQTNCFVGGDRSLCRLHPERGSHGTE